jgi:uncharacterized membrane protein
MTAKKKYILLALLLLALIGLVDSFIIHQKVAGTLYVPCIIGQGCETVLYSYYANFLGVPLAYWGMAFYVVIVSLLALRLSLNKSIFEKIYYFSIACGFLFSLYLLYVQIFLIGTLCTYCIISFSDVFFSVILSGVLIKDKKAISA